MDVGIVIARMVLKLRTLL